jgi:isopentenyl-diphosphate delta-isomerase
MRDVIEISGTELQYEEEVVLLDVDGDPIGTALKSAVHGSDTHLHLAFSCHVVNDDGLVLLTRRAMSKQTWPGVWTNSFCGHPMPAETVLAAVHRRAAFELGLELRDVELALPLFQYRAVDASGIVENELCPVYLARTSSDPELNPNEVMEYAWAEPLDLGESVRSSPLRFSPWLVLQAEQLAFLGGSGADRDSAIAASGR